jgi:hypothetical protein
MSRFYLSFSGEAKYVAVKDVGDKKVLEFQVAKKNYSKEKLSKEDEQWTNLRVTLFGASQFDIDRVKDGVFVSGGGEFSARSYVDKAGVKKQSLDCRVQAFGLDAAYIGREQGQTAEAAQANPRTVPDASACGAGGNAEPPFKSDLGADAWG